MELLYKNDKVKAICEDIDKAKKYFGGSTTLALALHKKIEFLMSATNLKVIMSLRPIRFHKLLNKGKYNNLEGYYAIDVKSVKDKWRIILKPLDDEYNSIFEHPIDKVANTIKIIEIKEVSNHYE